MVLRKYLLGAKLLDISQYSNDRILEFDFENINELGDKESKTLVIEMMGKHSNIILLNNNRNIIDSIKHVDFEISSIREVMPGRPYEYPPIHDKINPFETTEIPIENNFIGISTLGFNEIKNTGLSTVINATPNPCIIYQDTKLTDFYFIPPATVEYTNTKSFDSMSNAIDEYFNTKLNLASLNSYKSELSQLISKQFLRPFRIWKSATESGPPDRPTTIIPQSKSPLLSPKSRTLSKISTVSSFFKT
jgi:predicted ribosome quality control (RQC) complex YloA/Tae2 family protein